MMDSAPSRAPRYIWDGLYKSWEDASRVAGEQSRVHSGRGWLQRIMQQILEYRKEYQQYGTAMPPRPSNLPLVCSLVNPRSIVDLGGSSGWCRDYLENSIPHLRISSYTVVELPAVVEFMKQSRIHGASINYKRQGDELQQCDLLYVNSVLQYYESNVPLLDLIELCRPRHVLLDDLVAKDDEDFFTVQAHRDAAMPYRFIGLSRLQDQMASKGYRCLISQPYPSPVFGVIAPLEMSNFPKDKQLRYSLTKLFEKTSDR
jgi:putative methyltransferase (TIGR04325 family)